MIVEPSRQFSLGSVVAIANLLHDIAAVGWSGAAAHGFNLSDFPSGEVTAVGAPVVDVPGDGSGRLEHVVFAVDGEDADFVVFAPLPVRSQTVAHGSAQFRQPRAVGYGNDVLFADLLCRHQADPVGRCAFAVRFIVADLLYDFMPAFGSGYISLPVSAMPRQVLLDVPLESVAHSYQTVIRREGSRARVRMTFVG